MLGRAHLAKPSFVSILSEKREFRPNDFTAVKRYLRVVILLGTGKDTPYFCVCVWNGGGVDIDVHRITRSHGAVQIEIVTIGIVFELFNVPSV